MKEKTYENYTTGRMHIKYEQILTIEHEDIGTVYHIPIEGNIGMFFTPSEKYVHPLGRFWVRAL